MNVAPGLLEEFDCFRNLYNVIKYNTDRYFIFTVE